MSRSLSVAFLNENALGHGSYLPRFARTLAEHPEWGIRPETLDVLPLPPDLQRRADHTVRGLRKVGLDFHISRWRRVTSAHARNQLDELRRRTPLDAVVVNTQSVALDLVGLPGALPLLVGLDATFRQLSRTPWFAPNPVASALLPLTTGRLLRRERRLFQSVNRFLPWSKPVQESLVSEYGVTPARIGLLPPSLDLEHLKPGPAPSSRTPALPRVLFVGGDFARKGGPLLLEVFRQGFRSRAELHLVTQAPLEPEPGVSVHRGIRAGSDAWFQLWRSADLFVFPSRLETFGIVLLEALAFGVPVIAARTGAAADILEDGKHGRLLEALTAPALHRALAESLDRPDAARSQALTGRSRLEREFDLHANARRLAEWIHAAADTPGPG